MQSNTTITLKWRVLDLLPRDSTDLALAIEEYAKSCATDERNRLADLLAEDAKRYTSDGTAGHQIHKCSIRVRESLPC